MTLEGAPCPTLLYYRDIQCFIIAMPFNMILTLYVISCNSLSCAFSKLTIYIYCIIFMTNTSVMTSLYINKIIYVCLIKLANGAMRISYNFNVRISLHNIDRHVPLYYLKIYYDVKILHYNVRICQ